MLSLQPYLFILDAVNPHLEQAGLLTEKRWSSEERQYQRSPIERFIVVGSDNRMPRAAFIQKLDQVIAAGVVSISVISRCD